MTILGIAKPSSQSEEQLEDILNDDDYTYDDEDENKSTDKKESNSVSADPPYFVSPEYTTTVKVNETAVLDCNFRNRARKFFLAIFLCTNCSKLIVVFLFVVATKQIASNVIMWYNGSKLLFQNTIRLYDEARISVDANYSLTIRNVLAVDHGKYRCQVLPNNISMTANLEVQTVPIASIYGVNGREITNEEIKFHQGDRIEVECKGAGRPESTIKWFADGARAEGAGVSTKNGHLIIEHADHQHVRLYQCIADNSIGIGHASVSINVQCKIW